MKITFCDYNQDLISELVKQYEEHKKDLSFVCTFHHGDILENPYQAIVSPANSIGAMDGGIDLHYANVFGEDFVERVRENFKTHPFSEVLVGEAVVTQTNTIDHPFVISAPTMRSPRRIAAENVYLATRAAVKLAQFRQFSTLAIPGMGTGVGGVPYKEAAFAMMGGLLAADNYYVKNGV